MAMAPSSSPKRALQGDQAVGDDVGPPEGQSRHQSLGHVADIGAREAQQGALRMRNTRRIKTGIVEGRLAPRRRCC